MGTLWTRLANRVLDPSIVFSFDRNGYKRHRAEFTPEDLDAPMRGRVCLVTGGNSGLGLATARALAEREACVWLLCRNRERGNRAVQQITSETGNTDVHLGLVDVSSLESVRSFCNRFEGDRVDVLIHNAGILPPERLDTEDGLESTLATHLVGPYLMTQLLLPLLAKGDRARVIWVSSGGMYTQRLNTDEMENPPEPFDGVLAYARAKRGTVTLNRLWAKTLLEHGIASHAMHPGWADTPGVQKSIPGFWKVTQKILRTPEEGADTTVWLAICDKAQATAGLFWFDRKARSEFLLPRTKASSEEEEKFLRALNRWAGLSDSPGQFAAPSQNVSED